MGLTAVLLILAAAVAHASWNLCAKRAGDAGPAFVWLYAATAVVLYLPLAVIVPVVTGEAPTWRWLLGCAVSSALHVAYFVLLQHGYAVGDLSVVYPLARGTGPLLSVSAAVLILGERPGWMGLLGAAAEIARLIFIGTTGRSTHGWQLHGALFGVATGTAIAAYTLWDAHSVTDLAVPPLVMNWGSAVGETLILTPVALSDRSHLAKLWNVYRREVLAVAVLSPLAYILVLTAMEIAPVSLIAPARELSIVIGGLIAWKLLGEPHPGRRMTGAVVVLGGVVLLAVS